MTASLLFFLAITLLIPFLVFKSKNGKKPNGKFQSTVVIAHRGASGYYPENTLPSFSRAIEMGADMIELDVHLTSDDSLVVMHDNKVDRTTNGKGEINKMSFAQLRALDAGSWFGREFKGTKVPTLDEVLRLTKGRVKILVEIKWPSSGLYKGIVGKILSTVNARDAGSWVILQSFERAYIQEARKIAPHLECQQLVFGESRLMPVYFERSLKFGKFKALNNATSVNIFYLYLNKEFVDRMHINNQKVYVFTPNTREDMVRSLNLGADGVITNFPDIALRVLKMKL